MTTARAEFTEVLRAACPPWCRRTVGHELDPERDDWDGGHRMHQGPLFGRLRAWGYECRGGRPMTLTVDVERHADDLDEASLRQLAIDAVRAADWIEAHQLGD